MASSEHIELSDFIKRTHENLRNDAKSLGTDFAWRKHCVNKQLLQKYAMAMQELATKHWEDNCNKNGTAVKSRIQWVYAFCDYYFFKSEIFRQRTREQDIAKKINLDVKIDTEYSCDILKLLDVGSCYNPFKVFKCFDVLAVDIAPANKDVYRCDFLNIKIVDDFILRHNLSEDINVMPRCFFDIVVFSLLLEYLPCPDQRLLCCINAYNLLKFEGLLIIITPDSKHIGANAKFMKSWRYNLAKLGFSRIKYEKFSHIHCMAFRKSIHPDIASRWTKLQKDKEFFDQMLIPQDFNMIKVERVYELDIVNEKNNLELLNELPNFVD